MMAATNGPKVENRSPMFSMTSRSQAVTAFSARICRQPVPRVERPRVRKRQKKKMVIITAQELTCASLM